MLLAEGQAPVEGSDEVVVSSGADDVVDGWLDVVSVMVVVEVVDPSFALI